MMMGATAKMRKKSLTRLIMCEDSFEQARGTRGKGKQKAIDINVDIMQPRKGSISRTQDYNIAAHLRKIPAQLSVFDALTMSQELRGTLILVLQNPEEY